MQRARERLEGQLEDQRQELELARAAARARAEQKGATEIELERLEFEVIRQQKQAELDARKLELDLERARLQAEYDKRVLEAKLERDRIQVTQLTELLNRGQFAALAMQLAQDPAAIGPVIAHLANQRATDINRQLQALRLLVENDGLEGWQITEQAKTVLHQLIATWTEHSGQALPDAGAPPEIEAPHPQEMPAGQPAAGPPRRKRPQQMTASSPATATPPTHPALPLSRPLGNPGLTTMSTLRHAWASLLTWVPPPFQAGLALVIVLLVITKLAPRVIRGCGMILHAGWTPAMEFLTYPEFLITSTFRRHGWRLLPGTYAYGRALGTLAPPGTQLGRWLRSRFTKPPRFPWKTTIFVITLLAGCWYLAPKAPPGGARPS